MIPCRGTESKKDEGSYSGISGTRNLEAESIRRPLVREGV